MKRTDQPSSRTVNRPTPRNPVLPPLTPEEQAKRGQTIKDLTSFNLDQSLKKTQTQKTSTIRLKKLDHQPKPRNSAKDSSKENEESSFTTSASTSASKHRPFPKIKSESGTRFWTSTGGSTSTSQIEAGSENSSFSVEPEAEQAGINISKALKGQKESGDLEKFLKECGLPQYAETFREHGFDDLETITELQVKHFVEMKIPAGHQVKISRRIEQLREPLNNSIKNILPQADDSSSSSKINLSQINSSREGYYSQSGVSQIEVAQPDKDEAIGEDRGGRGLLDGEFNEADSHASFLEALNEWRSRKPVEQVKAEPVKTEKAETIKGEPPKRILRRVKSKEPKRVKIVAPRKEGEEEEDDEIDYISFKGTGPKKAFFFSGGDSWNKVEMPAHLENGTDMSPRSRRAAQKPKVSCWNCYQLGSDQECKKVGERTFCSDDCVKAFREQNSSGCAKRGCKNRFIKEEGVLREGNWYCGENCAPVSDRRARKGVSREEGEVEDEGMEAFELEVDFGNKRVLSMAQLEEKYSRNSMVESG